MASSNFGVKPSSNTSRNAPYSVEEDRVLCHVYLNVSQDPVTGRDQTMAQFWSRITTEYYQMMPNHMTIVRPWRSLQARWQIIMAAIGKFKGCVRQIESLNPSGASEQDIFEKAKDLLIQDLKFQKGFKFDHVWPILKNMEKYADTSKEKALGHRKRSKCNKMSPSEFQKSDKSIGSSSFCIDLNNDFEVEDSFIERNDEADRPIGRKKEKMKKEQNEEMKKLFMSMDKEIKGMFHKNQSLLEKNYELQLLRAQNETKKLELQQRWEDNKILCKDLDSIKDPVMREGFRNEQMKIYAKRAQEGESQGGVGSSSCFSQHFDFRGNGEDLPNY